MLFWTFLGRAGFAGVGLTCARSDGVGLTGTGCAAGGECIEHPDAHTSTQSPKAADRMGTFRVTGNPRLVFAAQTAAPASRVRDDQNCEEHQQNECCAVHRFLL